VKRKDDALRRPLDHSAAEAGAAKTSMQVATDLFVFDKFVLEIVLGVPVGIPTTNDAKAISDRMCFLTQGCTS
jgi:hypothetical protein